MNIEKEKRAIEYLKAFEPEDEPYYLCYSGGKDSDTIRILASLAGVKHDIVNNHTTVDAPETVRYIRSIPNIKINYPELTMWQLIVKKLMPPTRLMRYCCSELKEHGGAGRLKVTGVRWAESAKRKENAALVKILGKPKTNAKIGDELGALYGVTKQCGIIMNDDNDSARRFVEHCYRTSSTMINPIVDWEDDEVWDFLRYYGCKSNPLYQCGYKRIGCIGCPMAGGRMQKKEFARYPKIKAAYIRAFDRMLVARRESNLPTVWKDGLSVYKWWVGDDPNQVTFNLTDDEDEWFVV